MKIYTLIAILLRIESERAESRVFIDNRGLVIKHGMHHKELIDIDEADSDGGQTE